MLIRLYRIANYLWRHKVPALPKIIYGLQYLLTNCAVPPSCQIGKGTVFGYGGMSVIIHSRSVIGDNCMIGSCVTIGGKSGWYEVPVIGNNVKLASGCKLLGPVRIGNNVYVGANAVVTKDVPDNCVVAGIPAKIIAEDIDINDYIADGIKFRGDNPWPVTPRR